MHDSSSHEQAGLYLDNSDAQSFVDVHVAPGGKTHAYFDNNNYNFNSNNNNNNYIDTFDSKVDDLNSGINFKITNEEMTLGRGKSFVSSPSLNRKSIDIDNDNNDNDDNRAMIIEGIERKSLADYFADNADQVAPMYENDREKKSESKNNITDYYEKYSVQTAKILINTLFLPSQKICQYCANAKNNSVVYSDRLIYKKKSLDAKLVNYYHQFCTNQLLLYDDNLLINNNQDYMPIFNVSKTTHSGLCYSQVDKRDIFNYKTLGPSILLLDNRKIDNYLNTNTDYYHRQMIDSCCRVSRNVIFKPKVFQNINYQFKLINNGDNEAKDADCDEEIQYWMDFNEDARLLNSKNNNNTNDMFNLSAARLHNHRASLLMLEPILIMPDFTEPRRSEKKRITHSEHVKIAPADTMANTENHIDDTREVDVRILTLNKGEHQDGILFRVKKGWQIEFRLGPSLFGKSVDIFTNHPLTDDKKFDRHTYYRLRWVNDAAVVRVSFAGSFHYYITDAKEKNEIKPLASGYVLVEPELPIGKDKKLPLECIQCQTVLSKCLGVFSSWREKLLVSINSGYNTIHFTPIQELGGSKSAYCLNDQLKLNPGFNDSEDKPVTFDDVEKLTNELRNEMNVLSIGDIVLNHTANESSFLVEHPECSYNCLNCPHLRPAYLLDAALFELTVQVAAEEWEFKGIPSVVETEDHLHSIRYALHTYFLPLVKIHELFTLDIDQIVGEFLNLARSQMPQEPDQQTSDKENTIKIIQDPQFRRLKASVDMKLALRIYNIYRQDCFDEETRLKRCAEEFRKTIQGLNEAIITEIQNHLDAAVENTVATIRYFRVQEDGPRLKEVSARNPLTARYFTDYGSPQSLIERETIMYSDNGCYLMAHNGWLINSDPLKNFADRDSNIYLRRDLIAWADIVKLRYGNKPEDNPFLWKHMTEYVEQTARIFDGVRLDNCHSTPIPVAEFMLDAARRIRPDLYVVAELFTNSDKKDNIFVNRLGITSFIREAMSAWDSHEEGRLIYRYGGEPVGAFFQSKQRPLVPCIAYALFMDQTHDNPSPIEKRSVFDLLPSAALVSMACCASGSNRGYDELVPHHIHVIDENREYTAWNEKEATDSNAKYVGSMTGIISAKRAFNNLHYALGNEGFSQVFVDQMDPDIVAVTRHSPKTHETVVLVAYTAFHHPDSNATDLRRHVRPLRVEGVVEEIIFEARLAYKSDKNESPFKFPDKHIKDDGYINGLKNYVVDIREHIQIPDSKIVEKGESGDLEITQLNFVNFQPGSVIAIRVLLHSNIKPALAKLNQVIYSVTMDAKSPESELQAIIARMSLPDMNKALFCCDQEEREETADHFGVYNIPAYGPLVYAGLQGVISLLAEIRPHNDLGHPLCVNLREGNWLIDYIWQRLKNYEGTLELSKWFEQAAEPFKLIPRYLVPSYFDALVVHVYVMLLDRCYSLLPPFVQDGSTFVELMSLNRS